MTVVKLKNKNGIYISLENIKNMRLSLYNKNTQVKGITSGGWQNFLAKAGNKYISIQIRGVCNSGIESIIPEFAFDNTPVFCEITFSKNSHEKVEAKFFIELYERYFDAGNLENYIVILVSSGSVQYQFDSDMT